MLLHALHFALYTCTHCADAQTECYEISGQKPSNAFNAIDIDFSFPFLVVFRDLDLSFLAEKRNPKSAERVFESLQENEYVSGTPYR